MERSKIREGYDEQSERPTTVIPMTDTASNCTAPPTRQPSISVRTVAALDASSKRLFDHSDGHAAIVFVDMSGFTALTEVHGDHVAAEFAAMATAVLGPNDQLIKTIGDAVMVSCYDADAALTFLYRLGTAAHFARGFPMLRAGVSTGPVVKRRGDLWGDGQHRGTAGRTCRTRTDRHQPGCRLSCFGSQSGDRGARAGQHPKHEPAHGTFAVDAAGKHQNHVDPVWRMHVTAATTVTTRTHRGQLYRFARRLGRKSWTPKPAATPTIPARDSCPAATVQV